MPDFHGTTGRDDLVGGARIHLDTDKCTHRNNHVCPACAQLTDEETEALRQYFSLLAAKRADLNHEPPHNYRLGGVMDRLSELGTARGHAERRVNCARQELAEAEVQLAQANVAYWSYVGDNCLCEFQGDSDCPLHNPA